MEILADIISPGTIGVVVLLLLITLPVLLIRRRRHANTVDKQTDTIYKESQTILTALPVGIAIYDKNVRQEYINDALAVMFGVKDKEAHLAKHISLFDDPALNDDVKRSIRLGLDINMVVVYNLQKVIEKSYYATRFSHNMYIDSKVRYIKNSKGEIEKYILILNDITKEHVGELQLKQSLFTTQLAIKTSNIVQWNYDCQTKIFTSLNDSVGADREFLTSDDYLSLMHPDDLELVNCVLLAMQTGQDMEFSHDVRMKLPDCGDSWQYVTIDGAPIKDANGNVVQFTGFRKNNTKFVVLNQQLKEKNIHLDMVLRSGYIIPMTIDVEKNLLYVSSETETHMTNKIDHQAVSGLALDSMFSNIHPDDRGRIQQMFNKLKSGSITTSHQEYRYDTRGLFGEEVYDINCMGIDYDKNGTPDKIVGYMQNITERKKIVAQIKRQKEFLSSIFDSIPVPLHIKDMDDGGRYVYWNKESVKAFGDGLYKSAKDIVGDARARELEQIDRRVFDTGVTYMNEERIKRADGLEYDTIVHKSVIYNGTKKLLMVVRWDVSLRNEIQRKAKVFAVSMNALKAFTWYCDLRDSVLHFGDELEKSGIKSMQMNSIPKFAMKIHPDQQERFLSTLDDFCRQDSGEYTLEYLIDMADTGHYEWWECRGTLELVTYGGVSYKYLYGMNINVDTLKRNELAILKSKMEVEKLNKQNELILNNTNSGLVFLDNDYVVQWENLTTFMPGHPMTQNYRKGIVCHNDVRGFVEPCPNCVVYRSQKSGQLETKEIVYKDQIGELTAVPIYDDSHVRIGTVLKVVDITERKKAAIALERAKNEAEATSALMRNIIDFVPCLLFIKDITDNYRYITANQYFCDVIGMTADDIIGKTDHDIFSTELADRFRRDDLKAVESKSLYVFEEETTFMDKFIVWQTTKTSVKTVDGRHLMIAVALDVTAKRIAYNELQDAKERAEQSNRLKSAFLANMSHEIRTPLNAIIGFSELMNETLDEIEKQEYVKIINTNNDLLLRLISDILDLSKIEAGMIELQPTTFDMVDLFNELESTFGLRVTNPEVEFVCENPYRSCVVELDRNRFTQVITNFMTNAIKFTPKGQIRLGYNYVDGGVAAYVYDTGIGITPDKIDKVFERFEKLDDFAQGTGLGMAICKAIVDAYQGKIGVKSEYGKGSTFWAWIPIKASIKLY